jgi:flagellar hook assembly protein FlgD
LQRLLTTATLVGLLIATAAAFAVTERLKLTKSPLMPGTRVSHVFSPTCSCARGRANIKLKLRRPDALTLRIVDRGKHPVRVLVDGVETPRGITVFRWDGRTDENTRASDGVYRAEVHLARQHQTILLPNRIQLDTTPPNVLGLRENRQAFSPDGDKQADFVRLSYELSKPAHAVLYVDGKRVLVTYRHPAQGNVSWDGQAEGETLPPGTYTLELGGLDLAGNTTPVANRWRIRVEIRYIALASNRITGARAGEPFEIGVSTDARRYAWKLGRRHGFATTPVLRLRAPQSHGRYTLTVSERGHVSRAAVIVR